MRWLLDLIWPTLDQWKPCELREIKQSEDDDIAAIRECMWGQSPEVALQEARRLVDSEEDRRRTAEGKATTYLLFAGALVPLLTYLESSVWEGKIGTAPKWLSAVILMVAVLYLLGAGLWAFRAISVGVFHRTDVSDLVKIWRKDNPLGDLIRETLVTARMNRQGVNDKVTHIKMAHAFMTRAFFVFGLLLLVEAAWEICNSWPYKISVSLERAAPTNQAMPAPNQSQKP